MTASPVAAPERLETGELGPVLQAANREYEAHLDEAAAFHRLDLSLARPARVQRAKVVLALAFAGALGVSLMLAFAPRTTPAISAEVSWPVKAGHEPARAIPSASPQRNEAELAPHRAAPSPAPLAQRPAGSSSRPDRPQRSELDETARGDRAEAKEPALGPASEAPRAALEREVAAEDGPDCLSLARGGQARAAEACFLRRAEGSGLGAEMALYEVARLRRDVLADENGALDALAVYRARFAGGSLRREVDMLQLELLIEVGRTADALRESAALLTSTTGKRTAELRLWRGHIFRQKVGDLRAAEREYALGEQAEGSRRVDASYFRGLCLQALGDDAAAALAYERYLDQRGQSHATDARKRLEELRP